MQTREERDTMGVVEVPVEKTKIKKGVRPHKKKSK